MCYHAMHIKSLSSQGVGFAYIPCGKCEECRSSNKLAWSFRLCAEVEAIRKDGWKLGFCTLTYRDSNLPYVPPEYFQDVDNAPRIPCFDKSRVSNYIKSFRNWIWKNYRVKSCKYMLVSEFGSRLHRPHYHLLLSWPPFGFRRVKDSSGRYLKKGNKFVREKCELSADIVHAWLKENWTEGFMFPEFVSGGRTKDQQPFEVLNAGYMASRYAAKYICKDLSFDKELSKFALNDDPDKIKELRNYCPFHIQSKSLGLSLLRDMSDSDRLKLIEDGYCFEGEDEFKQIPLYIRNKIFFNPRYVMREEVDESTGEVTFKRCVLRDASDFFLKHYQEIFERRVCYYSDLIIQVMRQDFWISRGLSASSVGKVLDVISGNFSALSRSPRELAADYLAYYGVNYAACFDVDRSLQWFSRYAAVFDDTGQEIGNYLDLNDKPLVIDTLGYEYLDSVRCFWTGVFECLSLTNGYINHDFELDDVQNFFAKQKELVYAV